MHAKGEGGPQDFTQARYLWEQAAAQGEAGAMIALGASYRHGRYGMEQDLNEAMRWYLKAKAHGEDVSTRIVLVMEERKREKAASIMAASASAPPKK